MNSDCSTEVYRTPDGWWNAVCSCGWGDAFTRYQMAGAAARAHA
jgi:hypothetical protein